MFSEEYHRQENPEYFRYSLTNLPKIIENYNKDFR